MMREAGIFAAGAAGALWLVRQSVRQGARAARQQRGLYSAADVSQVEPPLVLHGEVVKGFGRGGKLLGCPTANIDEKAVGNALESFGTGVYFGWAKLDGQVYKMVTSIGWNPYFKNDKKTVEPHILHDFKGDFYGKMLSIVVCAKIRPELNFDSMEALVEAIDNDKAIAVKALDDKRYEPLKAKLS
ncbi:Riboflavin kinase [Hondaea fermentalgiana]|uniref:riboflavin kinase n=1 Tax=Hondaea fermentalgiana TaxID=2315210 RepID=A0A2R5G588_9STRA|nr:Riboflavin kinase [Hondaea fermentalgiana]|eukprot:GBG25705.1 Riboflavin kinase [Hondaea fermentalgiana]